MLYIIHEWPLIYALLISFNLSIEVVGDYERGGGCTVLLGSVEVDQLFVSLSFFDVLDSANNRCYLLRVFDQRRLASVGFAMSEVFDSDVVFPEFSRATERFSCHFERVQIIV